MASSGCESLGNSWNYLSSPTDGGSLESISSLSSLKSRRILTGRALPLKADGSPAASSLSYPGKIIIKGQRALSALPWSCSSLQSSTFGLSSSVPLIKHWGGAGRGQLWLPHLPPAQPSPAGSSPLQGVTLQVPGSSSTNNSALGDQASNRINSSIFIFFKNCIFIFLISRSNCSIWKYF